MGSFWFHSSNGGFSLDTVTVPRTKIQAASIRTNPLQRYARVATVLVDTAAGVGSTRHKLIDVSKLMLTSGLIGCIREGGSTLYEPRLDPKSIS